MWAISFVLLSAAIVTGNVTVLVVFTRTPSLRKRKHYLLVSLAVADLLVGFLSVPMFITILLARYTVSIRKIYNIQDILFATASVFGLTAVAIERAYAVYFPFKHRTLWKGVYMIGIAVIWMMAAFLGLCSISFNVQVQFYAANMAVVISLAVIIILYFLIWVKMTCMTSVQGHAIQGRDNRLTVTLLIVTVLSVIAWIPFEALSFYAKLCGIKCYSKNIVYVTKLLHYGNSLVNPIIYALRMPQFKTALLHRLRRCLAFNSSCSNRLDTNRHSHHDNDVVNYHVNACVLSNSLGNLGNNGNVLELNILDNHDDRNR